VVDVVNIALGLLRLRGKSHGLRVLNLVFKHFQLPFQLFPTTGVMVGSGSTPGCGHGLGQEFVFFG
jgi:hypothetical protein